MSASFRQRAVHHGRGPAVALAIAFAGAALAWHLMPAHAISERETLEAARSAAAKDVISTPTFTLQKRDEHPFDAAERPAAFEAMPALEAGVEDEATRNE